MYVCVSLSLSLSLSMRSAAGGSRGLAGGVQATTGDRRGERAATDRDIVKMNPGVPLSFPNSNAPHLNSCYCREKHGVKK